MLKEFKDFIAKGNLIDLAVGLVMGVAFTSVTTSFMEKIVNPLIAKIAGAPNFEKVGIVLGTTTDKDGKVVENLLGYGSFFSTILNFVITGFVMFLVVKAYNKMKAASPVDAEVPADVALLTEIRDSLKK